MTHYSDEAILEGLKGQDRDVIRYIYKEYYPSIKFLIISNSGNETDAEDVFQDAMVIIYRKIIENKMILTSSFKTFLYSICRNLWLQKLDRKLFSYEFMENENLTDMQDAVLFELRNDENEKYRLFQQHFLRLSDDCKKILRLFMNKVPLREIAEIMGFKTEKYAKTRKFMCKEKLKNAIYNDPNCKKFLTNE